MGRADKSHRNRTGRSGRAGRDGGAGDRGPGPGQGQEETQDQEDSARDAARTDGPPGPGGPAGPPAASPAPDAAGPGGATGGRTPSDAPPSNAHPSDETAPRGCDGDPSADLPGDLPGAFPDDHAGCADGAPDGSCLPPHPACGARRGHSRPGRPPAMAPEERRKRIFEALDHLFREGGMEGVTMSAIAGRAGMSKRTLYTIFADRDTLLLAYMEALMSAYFRPLTPREAALPLEKRLRLILTISESKPADGWELPLETLRLAVADGGTTGHRLGLYTLRLGPRRMRARLRQELDRAVTRGEIPEIDTGAAAELLHDMAQVPLLEALLDAGYRPGPEEGRKRLDMALACFFHGLHGLP